MGVRVGLVIYALAALVLLGLVIANPDHNALDLLSPVLHPLLAVLLWINLTVSMPARVRRWDQEHASDLPHPQRADLDG